MKKNILNLEGVVVLNARQQKKINGGTLLTKYDPANPCQNATEIVPTGCPCPTTQYLRCASTYGSGSIGNNGGPVMVPGVCSNGVCA